MLIDIEQNIANLEKCLIQGRRGSWSDAIAMANTLRNKTEVKQQQHQSRSSSTDRKRSTTLRSVRSLIRLGKQRPPRDSSTEDETRSLIRDGNGESGGVGYNRCPTDVSSGPISRAGSQTSLSSDNESQISISLIDKAKKTSK